MFNNPIPEHLRSNYLFLLVGTNPLPNWVAAKLLWKNEGEGKVFLVHSSGTLSHAERLEKILKKDNIPAERVPTLEANSQEIHKAITNTISTLYQTKLITNVGLNYTGGTKMMSVHAHQAIRDNTSLTTYTLSYLDARTLCMKFDGGDPNGYPISLSSEVEIGIRKLLDLHEDYTKEDDVTYQTQPKAELAAAALAKVHKFQEAQNVWRDWCYDILQINKIDGYKMQFDRNYRENTLRRIDSKTFLPIAKFQAEISKLPPFRFNPILKSYENLLTALDSEVTGNFQFKDVASRNGFDDSYELARWLDGQWLEHYTLAEIKKCVANASLNNTGVGINIEAKNKEGRIFEADVIAMRGYQLFYFSCYSGSKHKDAKMKLFEAMIRASQLGGDEAMVALVSCADDVGRIERQAESDWQKAERIKVFGRNDLETLSTHLTKWFNNK